jgi:hypothetical protein
MGSYYELVQELQQLNAKVDTINSILGGISSNVDVVSNKIVVVACCCVCVLICLGVSLFVKKGWMK